MRYSQPTITRAKGSEIMSLKINKELLREIVGEYAQQERFEVVQNVISDHDSWSIYYDCIIKDKETGKFYDASYSQGATESQDEYPFQYDETDDDGNIELNEVEPYEEVITKYRRLDNACR